MLLLCGSYRPLILQNLFLCWSLLCCVVQLTRAYDVSWSVNDENSGNNYGQQESRRGDLTTGKYHVLLPDGRLQTVTYRVDPFIGFVAKVEYEYVGMPEIPVRTDTTDDGSSDYDDTSRPQSTAPDESNFGTDTDTSFDYYDTTTNVDPPDYPEGSIGNDATPDNGFPSAPDYPTSESGDQFPNTGGLFPGDEILEVPDIPLSSFFPGENVPSPEIGIRFPEESSGIPGTIIGGSGNLPSPGPSDTGLETLFTIFKNTFSVENDANSIPNKEVPPSDGFDPQFPPPPDFIPVN